MPTTSNTKRPSKTRRCSPALEDEHAAVPAPRREHANPGSTGATSSTVNESSHTTTPTTVPSVHRILSVAHPVRDCALHGNVYFAGGFQFCRSVIGTVPASSSATLIRKRPSGATSYCACAAHNPPPRDTRLEERDRRAGRSVSPCVVKRHRHQPGVRRDVVELPSVGVPAGAFPPAVRHLPDAAGSRNGRT